MLTDLLITEAPHVIEVRHPDGFVVIQKRGIYAQYLNQSSVRKRGQPWSGFASVFKTVQGANAAMRDEAVGKFGRRRYATVPGSD